MTRIAPHTQERRLIYIRCDIARRVEAIGMPACPGAAAHLGNNHRSHSTATSGYEARLDSGTAPGPICLKYDINIVDYITMLESGQDRLAPGMNRLFWSSFCLTASRSGGTTERRLARPALNPAAGSIDGGASGAAPASQADGSLGRAPERARSRWKAVRITAPAQPAGLRTVRRRPHARW